MGGITLVLLLLLGPVFPAKGGQSGLAPDEINLKGYWKFQIGDQAQWASADFSDAGWPQIKVPSRWEDAGYEGYDGIAWYRTSVVIPREMSDRTLVLRMGYIDDADEVYLNGRLIGKSGTFPPRHITAFNALRNYQVPANLVRFGEQNVIAVRVYDSHLEGGIVSGDVKIFSDRSVPSFDVMLTGEWMFNKGFQYDPSGHETIFVPGAWESQGYEGYNGYAVYTRKLKISPGLARQRLVLMAGRIDDVDRLYINGQFIGETGDYDARYPETRYREIRNYFIPPGVLKSDSENIIELRIRDTGGEGGVTEGPVGIITQDKFRQYWKNRGR